MDDGEGIDVRAQRPGSVGAASLADVLATSELTRRPNRPPDHAAENRALVALATATAEAPDGVLQQLAEVAVELCRADSAGISLLEEEGGQPVFRWHAAAGDFSVHLGGTTPRDFSPSGVVLDRKAVQLLIEPARHFACITDLGPVAELLLIPFPDGDAPIGTLWVSTRRHDRHFDAEDLRQLTSLTRFAAAGVEALEKARAAENAERRLRDLQSRLEATLDTGAVGTWVLDVATDRVFADRNLARLFGVSPAEAEGGLRDRYLAAIHEEDRAGARANIERALRAGGPFEGEFRIVRGDGTTRWVVARGRVERDANGVAVRFPGVTIDVTERRLAEERERQQARDLAMATAKFRAFFDQSLFYAGIMELDGTVIDVNRSAVEQCGYRSEDVLGKPFWETAWWRGSPSAQERLRAGTARAAAGRAYREELPYWLADGTERVVDFALTPVWGEGGKVVFVVPTGLDITDRKRAEEALTESDRRKTEFLATLAHELRNPLAPMRNAIEVLKRAGGDLAAAEASRALVERQMQQLVRLVDDLLDVSRISTGKLELRRERVLLTDVVRTAVETSRPVIEAGQHELTLELPARPIHLDADPTRLAQALVNLLNNAARYSERGKPIRLSAEREGDAVAVRVKDFGIGIAADMLPRVFDLFTQVDRSLESSRGGLGIGLTLVKRLVEMHDGQVEAHSRGPGEGSEFVVRLPLAKPVAVPAGHAAEPPTRQDRPLRRVLVVDDNEDSAESLSLLLSLQGHEVRTAHDGPTALCQAEAFAPEVVLLDIGLPGLSGYDVARRLRADPRLRAATLVALTGWGQDDDRRRSREAGFDHHLVKPADPIAVEKILAMPRNA